MATTISTLTPAELRAELQELLDLACEYAALEDRLRRKAIELERTEWLEGFKDRRYVDAVAGQVRPALSDAVGNEDERAAEFGTDDLCRTIEAAIAVVDFAIEKGAVDG